MAGSRARSGRFYPVGYAPRRRLTIADWDSDQDVWELYNLAEDFSQANDLAAEMPEKLAEMKARFLEVAEDNKDFPIGAGNWLRIHPEDRITSAYDSWTFGPETKRMPEFAAPGIGRQSTRVTIDAEFGEAANGVLYAVGGAGGGLSVYVDDGVLTYEYNMLIIQNTQVQTDPIPAGRHEIVIDTTIAQPGGAADVVITIDGDGGRNGAGARHGARRLYRDRELRRWPRSGLAGIIDLRRNPPLRVRWHHPFRASRPGCGTGELIDDGMPFPVAASVR